MTPAEFRNIYRELIDDNPLAVRAVLKILTIEFTTRVPTLAVTCEERPTLRVNLRFLERHCHADAEVRAVIVHEFLHVLLRHTERFTPVSTAEHVAFDAVINAIIHRTMGTPASRMMSRYYADVKGPFRLLRPPTEDEVDPGAGQHRVVDAWLALYDGSLVADDIRALADDLLPTAVGHVTLLGNHTDGGSARVRGAGAGEWDAAWSVLDEALDRALKSMNGSGVFRAPALRGVGAVAYQASVGSADAGVERWRRETYAVLRRHLMPDVRAARESVPAEAMLPVLSPSDRRAAVRARWSPFLPDARWSTSKAAPAGSAYVYLDASGSMDAELPLIVTLLARLSGYVRRPFWAFSDVVAPARIENQRLVTDTTGGTSMRCVLEHVMRCRPSAAVVITDGYIEPLTAGQVQAVRATRLHILVTRDGTTVPFARVGLPYTQLGKVPQ